MEHRGRSRGGLASLLDRWYRLRPIERDGRIYAAFGLVPVFELIARLFGEELPRSDRRTSFDPRQVCLRARYHELINLMSIAAQLPLAFLAWSASSTPLILYALALLVPHILAVMLERYKRSQCGMEPSSTAGSPMGAAPSVREGEATAEPIQPDRLAPHASPDTGVLFYFGPFACETERLYAVLGVEAFRRFVMTLIRLSAPLDAEGASLRNVVGGRSGLAAFDAQTRTAELTHLFGTLLHVPFAVAFARSGHIGGLLFVVVLFGLNIVCALLQRQHRVRIAGLMRKVRQRPLRSARHA